MRQVAAQVGYCSTYVAKLLQPIARSRSEAAKLRQPRQSTHWRTARMNARKTVEEHLGRKLQTTEHVHHINGDYTDNRIENLQVLEQREHAFLHHPANPVPRGRRPERQAYMRAYREARKWR